MAKLKLLKAYYYDPKRGYTKGTVVTDELNSLIKNDVLFFQGTYNNVFPDHFKSVRKKLRIELKYRYKKFVKIYNENDLINIPDDLNIKNNFLLIFNNPWFVTIIGGLVVMVIGSYLLKQPAYIYNRIKSAENNINNFNDSINEQSIESNLATTTTNIADLLSRALSLDTLVERQDFLTKYIGDKIYGKGVVKQISRWGDDKLLVDIIVNNTTISCLQEGSEENEKHLLLLKGKTVNFSGIFTYTKTFEHGLDIKECKIF